MPGHSQTLVHNVRQYSSPPLYPVLCLSLLHLFIYLYETQLAPIPTPTIALRKFAQREIRLNPPPLLRRIPSTQNALKMREWKSMTFHVAK